MYRFILEILEHTFGTGSWNIPLEQGLGTGVWNRDLEQGLGSGAGYNIYIYIISLILVEQIIGTEHWCIYSS